MALVDSGADYPIFPMETAQCYLGLDLTLAEVWNFSGTSGLIQVAKLAEVSLAVLRPDGSQFCEISITCAFCDTFQMSGGVLLRGRMDFSPASRQPSTSQKAILRLNAGPSVERVVQLEIRLALAGRH